MRYALAAAIAAILLLPPAAPAEEVQGWAPLPGSTDARHIHTQFPFQMLGTVSGPTSFTLTSLFHNRVPGDRITLVRWATQDGIVESKAVSHTAAGGNVETFTDTLTLDPSKAAHSGWQEVRITANVLLTDGTREFSTTRQCMLFQSGKPRSDYCWNGSTSKGRCGGGAWYGPNGGNLETSVPGYLIATVSCPDVRRAQQGLRPGETIQVRTQNTAGGFGTWDPDFHNGNLGHDQFTTPASNVWKTITIPAMSPGVHKLHLRDSRAGFSGAYVLPVKII